MALRKSGIDESFKGKWIGMVKTLSDEQKEYKEKLCQIINYGNPWCLVVCGDVGNGKSFLAQVAVNTFNDNGFRGGFYTTQALLQDDLRGGSSDNLIRQYSNYPLLVIDELSDRESDWTAFIKTSIESILVERHRQGNRTILIGNLDFDRLVAMFDVRVRDRLQEGMIQPMVGPSLRREYGK